MEPRFLLAAAFAAALFALLWTGFAILTRDWRARRRAQRRARMHRREREAAARGN